MATLLFADIGLSRLSKLLYGASFVGLAAYSVLYIFDAYRCIVYPYQMDYVEGFLLYFADTLSQGQSIYQDMSTYPFIPGLYPPVYALACAPLVKLFGISFSIGRLISVLSAILIGILIYKIVGKMTDRRIAIISVLLFFASPYIYNWTCLFRVDTLGLLFTLIGIYLVFRYEKSKIIYLSIPFFLLAVYTKQSLIAAPIASFIYLFLKDKKLGITNASIFGISGILLLLLCNYVTEGRFYLHTVTYQGFMPSTYRTIELYLGMIQTHAILFGFAFVQSVYIILKKKPGLFAYYFVASALIAVTVGRPGSHINYFLELIVACCILFGTFLSGLQPQLKKGNLAGILVMIMLLVQLALFAHMPYTDMAEDLRIGQELSSRVQSSEGSVLSEDAGLVVINNREPLIEFAIAMQLEKRGLWDQSNFVSDLQNKKFSLILLKVNANHVLRFLTLEGSDAIMKIQQRYSSRQRFTIEMLEAIVNNYHLVETIGEYYVYEPNEDT